MEPASKIIRPRKGAPAAAEKAEVPEESRGEDSHHQSRLRLNKVFLSHPVSFPFLFSLQHPLFSSLFSRENHQIFRALY